MIPVLLDNEDIIAVNKPEGLAVVPERNRSASSLVEALSEQCDTKFYVVHRIDKETSGVVVLAKNAQTHRWLNTQFETRAVKKTYLALVHGRIEEDTGVIDKPLRQFGSGRVGVDSAGGKDSLTEFRVLERYSSFTLVQAFPRTGRRHQIRVHLYSIGHSIAGDPLYGDKTIQQNTPRLMLHAQKIVLTLLSKEVVTIEGPIPVSFGTVVEAHIRL